MYVRYLNSNLNGEIHCKNSLHYESLDQPIKLRFAEGIRQNALNFSLYREFFINGTTGFHLLYYENQLYYVWDDGRIVLWKKNRTSRILHTFNNRCACVCDAK